MNAIAPIGITARMHAIAPRSPIDLFRIRMKEPAMLRRLPIHLALLVIPALWSTVTIAAAPACSPADHCAQVSTFTARVTDFRTTVQGSSRRIIATVSFQNLTDRPLVIGYVSGSALGLDEHGNRYTLARTNGVRGMGEIERNRFDSRFTLQAGERSDARFELDWYAGDQIAGVDLRLDLALREIDAVAGNQYRLGREHLVSFAGLRDGLPDTRLANTPGAAPATMAAPVAAPASTATTAAPVIASTTAAGGVAPVADPCEGRPACQAAGPFLAEVTQVSPGQQGSTHLVQVRLSLRNLGNQPLVLGYQQRSGTMLDELGQQYTVDWRYDQDVAGIGQVTRNKADPQFVLSPGEARTASFTFRRHVGRTQVGTVFSPSLVIEQLEILPSQQVRSAREYALGFTGLTGNQLAGAAQDVGDSLKQLGDGLRSIFKRK